MKISREIGDQLLKYYRNCLSELIDYETGCISDMSIDQMIVTSEQFEYFIEMVNYLTERLYPEEIEL